jgi:hypothetical protein
MVNILFTYAPDGKAIFCSINFPSSWHDGSMMTNISPYIHKLILTYKICVDQGFPRSGDTAKVLLGPISQAQAHRLALNWFPTDFFYLMFMFLYDRQVNGV